MIALILKESNSFINKMIFQFPNSAAVSSVAITGEDVSIVYKSSNKEYDFVTTEPAVILEFLQNPGDVSVGHRISQWEKDGILISVEQLATV
jgi:hypothetical protein